MEHSSNSLKVLRLFPWAMLFAECPHRKQATCWTCKMDEGDSNSNLLDVSTSSSPLFTNVSLVSLCHGTHFVVVQSFSPV